MYVINHRMGIVHENTCSRVNAVAVENLGVWYPDKAHLAPGVTYCPVCLTAVPVVEPPLLEDKDGSPYPEEVQALVRLLQANTGTYVVDVLMRALDAMRLHGVRQARDAIIGDGPPLNFELRPDGSSDPSAAVYVEGFHDALVAVDALLPREESPWVSES